MRMVEVFKLRSLLGLFKSSRLLICGLFVWTLNAQTVLLSTSSLAFGTQAVNTTSEAQAVTVTYRGASSLGFTSISATGPFIESDNCLGASLSQGNSCTILVSFTPTGTGPLSGQLTIIDSDASSPQTVNLSGTGMQSSVRLSASSLTFPSQELHALGVIPLTTSTSSAQLVTLTNTGSGLLTITNVGVTGDFTEFDDCIPNLPPNTIAAGLSCTFVINFTPTVAGTRTGQLTVTDGTGANYVVALTGLGVGTTDVRLLSSSLTFGSQQVSTTSAAQVVTVTVGNAFYLQTTSLKVIGDFAIVGNNCVGVAVPQFNSCEILVTFTPTQAGTRTGQIIITDTNSFDTSNYVPDVVTLLGTGTSDRVVLSSSSLTFGTQSIGAAGLPQTVTITNTGTSDLVINNIDTQYDSANVIEIDNCLPLPPATSNPIHPGKSCTIQVTWAPYDFGRMLVGKIVIDDSGSGSPHFVATAGPGGGPGTVSPSFLNAAGAVTTSIGSTYVSKIASIGNFTETNSCTPASCTLNVAFPGATGAVQTGQVTLDDPTVVHQSPMIVALSTAPSTALVATTTSLTSSANPATSGQQITLTATVSLVPPGTGTPSGSVTFLDGGLSLGSATLTGGQAALPFSSLPGGTHSLTAFYGGGDNFLTSVSAALSETVNANPAPAITSSNKTTFSELVAGTFTVTTSGTPAPTLGQTGNLPVGVSFMDNGSGSATLSGTPAAGTAGTYVFTIKASNGVTPDASQVFTLTVNSIPSATALTVSSSTPVFGQNLSFTVVVSSSLSTGPVPTGNVTLNDGSTLLATVVLTSGTATYTTAALSVGAHAITASYGGDADFASSTSPAGAVKIAKASTSTALAVSPNPPRCWTGRNPNCDGNCNLARRRHADRDRSFHGQWRRSSLQWWQPNRIFRAIDLPVHVYLIWSSCARRLI